MGGEIGSIFLIQNPKSQINLTFPPPFTIYLFNKTVNLNLASYSFAYLYQICATGPIAPPQGSHELEIKFGKWGRPDGSLFML